MLSVLDDSFHDGSRGTFPTRRVSCCLLTSCHPRQTSSLVRTKFVCVHLLITYCVNSLQHIFATQHHAISHNKTSRHINSNESPISNVQPTERAFPQKNPHSSLHYRHLNNKETNIVVLSRFQIVQYFSFVSHSSQICFDSKFPTEQQNPLQSFYLVSQSLVGYLISLLDKLRRHQT